MHKTNVLTHAGGLWSRTFAAVAAEFPDVTTEYQHIDAASMFMVSNPQRYDVVVTDNLFGDILTDIAAAVTGGIGMAASGSVNPERKYPSTFEPVHGSAPDIAGQGIADPAAAILSASLLLEHLGHADEARASIRGGRGRGRVPDAGRAAAYRRGRGPGRRRGRLSRRSRYRFVAVALRDRAILTAVRFTLNERSGYASCSLKLSQKAGHVP